MGLIHEKPDFGSLMFFIYMEHLYGGNSGPLYSRHFLYHVSRKEELLMKERISSISDINQTMTGIHLKKLRESSNYTVKEIAIFAGISDKSVYAWESGTSIPSLSNLIGLKSLYKLNHIDDLLVFSL